MKIQLTENEKQTLRQEQQAELNKAMKEAMDDVAALVALKQSMGGFALPAEDLTETKVAIAAQTCITQLTDMIDEAKTETEAKMDAANNLPLPCAAKAAEYGLLIQETAELFTLCTLIREKPQLARALAILVSK